jgi:hypothetical protein
LPRPSDDPHPSAPEKDVAILITEEEGALSLPAQFGVGAIPEIESILHHPEFAGSHFLLPWRNQNFHYLSVSSQHSVNLSDQVVGCAVYKIVVGIAAIIIAIFLVSPAPNDLITCRAITFIGLHVVKIKNQLIYSRLPTGYSRF